MVWIYIGMILLAAFPLVLTIVRMKRTIHIKKKGVPANAVVREIRTLRTGKGGSFDVLVLEYKERTGGGPYYAKATVTHQKHRIGDSLPIFYLAEKPAKYAIAKTAYLPILIFCIILFLFVIFAVYKINEMVAGGNIYRA